MATQDYQFKLREAVDNYYHYNPCTLMPLLMITLAAQGKLQSNTYNPNIHLICGIIPSEVATYDWVRFNPALCSRINEAIKDGKDIIGIGAYIDNSLIDIYDTFYEYDNYTVKEEHLFRLGILFDHSDNKLSDEALRQYAMICLGETLIDTPTEWLKKNFLEEANNMLVKSGLQPARPRLEVAYALKALLNYDGKGRVYNPFAGCAIAAAAINAGANMEADGDGNDKLFAVARLLNYGMGGSCDHYANRDSTKWFNNNKIDYVLSTYKGYVGEQSAFDFCLSKCFDTLTDCGKFAGVIAPKDIFEKRSEEFQEALKQDWVETIVLLPFGEVAVLINAKKDESKQGQILFFNFTHPTLKDKPIYDTIINENNAEIYPLSYVKNKGFFRDLMSCCIDERKGYKLVKLGDIVNQLKRETYTLANVMDEEKVMAYIDKNSHYNKSGDGWMDGIKTKSISSLFVPAYHLTKDSLIINHRGETEPRLFDAQKGSAYFQDGYAFELKDRADADWIIEQLREEYVSQQLHPYGMHPMVPEAMTEEQILNIQLYKKVEEIEAPMNLKIAITKVNGAYNKEAWGVEIDVKGNRIPIYIGSIPDKMIYICTLLKRKSGQELYKSTFGKHITRNNEMHDEVRWLKKVYETICKGTPQSFNEWYVKMNDKSNKMNDKSNNMTAKSRDYLRDISQGKSQANAKIRKKLKDHPEALDYCTIQIDRSKNKLNTSYYVNIAPDDIIVPNEFNECLY